MIKNILYSLLIHFLLLVAVYYGFLKNNQDKLETESETLISIASLDNLGGTPPINEAIIKPQDSSKPSTNKDINQQKTPPNEVASPTNQAGAEVSNKKNLPEKNDLGKNDLEKQELEKKEKILPAQPSNKNAKDPQNKESLANFIENKLEQEEATKTPSKSPEKITQKITEKTQEKDSNLAKSSAENIDKTLKATNLKLFKDITNEDYGSKLTSREAINIKSQLKLCYKRALEESGLKSKDTFMIKIQISQLGYIKNDLDEIIDITKYNDPIFKDYKIIIDNIKRALVLCNPLRNLPIEKYDSWKEITLEFEAKDISK